MSATKGKIKAIKSGLALLATESEPKIHLPAQAAELLIFEYEEVLIRNGIMERNKNGDVMWVDGNEGEWWLFKGEEDVVV